MHPSPLCTAGGAGGSVGYGSGLRPAAARNVSFTIGTEHGNPRLKTDRDEGGDVGTATLTHRELH